MLKIWRRKKLYICTYIYICILMCSIFILPGNKVYMNIVWKCPVDGKQRITLLKRCFPERTYLCSLRFMFPILLPSLMEARALCPDHEVDTWFISIALVHIWSQEGINMTHWGISSDGRDSHVVYCFWKSEKYQTKMIWNMFTLSLH